MSSMSKRAQARTERELQEILNLPGNSVCADCGTRNPAWASWNIGIFLCMRCATLHRKLGTHISKVKSLSMDTWTSEQVESMRKNGNVAVNKMCNPKNKKPDIPLDADEVDNAMERFIRKKYQEKSLLDGRPEVPSRDEPSQVRSKSPDTSPPPALPVKKKGFWTGFGLRASSSAYPLSKHDKKHRNEPRVDSAFRITSEDYTSTRQHAAQADLSDRELNKKLIQLRDMGFGDDERNTALLKKSKGDVERTIAALIKLGPTEKELAQRKTPDPVQYTRDTASFSAAGIAQRSAESPAISSNPFDALDRLPQRTPSSQPEQQQAIPVNTNPWQAAMSSPQTTGLEQSFTGMQVTPQALFPHNTGGYATYQQPSTPQMPQFYSATTSPVTKTNPFLQQMPLSAHSTGSNPYAAHMQNLPSFAPSTNPFLSNQQSAPTQTSILSNPFGLPPSQSPSESQPQSAVSQSTPNPFDAPFQANQSYSQQSQMPQSHQFQPQYQYQTPPPATLSSNFTNSQYGLSQTQSQPPVQTQAQFQQQQGFPSPQASYNPFIQQQPQQQQQQQQQQQHHLPQTLSPQQTGRFDKASILAMYNHPQFAPQQPLASIPEPVEAPQQASPYPLSPTPATDLFSNTSNPARRAVTMPVSSSSPAPTTISRNPFFNNANTSATNMNGLAVNSTQAFPAMPQFSPNPVSSANPYYPPGGARHVSADSVAVNNPALMDGRHSPDAWGGLSARYVR